MLVINPGPEVISLLRVRQDMRATLLDFHFTRLLLVRFLALKVAQVKHDGHAVFLGVRAAFQVVAVHLDRLQGLLHLA